MRGGGKGRRRRGHVEGLDAARGGVRGQYLK